MAQTTTRVAPARELTFEDYRALPVSRQHGEVVDGVLTVMPSPSFRHQVVQGRIFRGLDDFVRNRDWGVVITAPADVLVRKRPKLRVRQPDVMFFSNARAGFRVAEEIDRLQEQEIAPDLAVEILSPGQSEASLAEKLADYASIRVEEVWLVDLERKTVQVLARELELYRAIQSFAIGERIVSRVLPGLEMASADILA